MSMCPAGSGDGTAEAGHGHGAVAGGEVVHEFAAELEERGAIDVVDDRHAGFLQDFEPFGFHAGRVGAACVRAGLCRGDEDGAVGFGQVLQYVDRHDDRACGVGMAGGGGVGLQVVELRGDDDADWIFLGVNFPVRRASVSSGKASGSGLAPLSLELSSITPETGTRRWRPCRSVLERLDRALGSDVAQPDLARGEDGDAGWPEQRFAVLAERAIDRVARVIDVLELVGGLHEADFLGERRGRPDGADVQVERAVGNRLEHLDFGAEGSVRAHVDQEAAITGLVECGGHGEGGGMRGASGRIVVSEPEVAGRTLGAGDVRWAEEANGREGRGREGGCGEGESGAGDGHGPSPSVRFCFAGTTLRSDAGWGMREGAALGLQPGLDHVAGEVA